MKVIVAEYSSRLICIEVRDDVEEIASKVKKLRSSYRIVGIYDLVQDPNDVDKSEEKEEE